MRANLKSYIQQLPADRRSALSQEIAGQQGPELQKMAAELGVQPDTLAQDLGPLLRAGAARYGDRTQAAGGPAATTGAALGAFRFQDHVADAQTRIDALSGDHALRGDFPPPADLAASVAALKADLGQVPASGGGTVLDKLQRHPLLSPEQKTRVLSALAETRDAFLAKVETPASESGPTDYQIVNWQHTRAEIDFVMTSARVNDLDPQQTEDALLASIFSDSVKTPKNFITHNLDGAKAAAEVLPRYFDVHRGADLRRLEGIVRAIEEHQIGPPSFMGNIIARGMMTGQLSAALAGRDDGAAVMDKVGNPFALAPERRQALAAQLADPNAAAVDVNGASVTLTAPEASTLRAALGQAAARDSAANKIANPFEHATHVSPEEHGVAFSEAELEVLSTIGVQRWAVPDPDSPHHAASRAVIDGDSLVNYATPEGFAKIVAIRGPATGPFFTDARIEDSLQSARQSFDDAYTAMTPKAQRVADRQKAKTEATVQAVMKDLRSWLSTQDNLPLNEDGSVPFLDADLSYPPNNDAEQLASLSPLQQQQFELAGRIRNKAVELLKAAHAEGVK